MTRYVERLTTTHNRRGFTCGRVELDEWFWQYAGQAESRHDSSRVFVLVDDEVEDGSLPLGYYALVGHGVLFDAAPTDLARGQAPNQMIGAVLLARLAVCTTLQRSEGEGRRGVGESLLADAVGQVLKADAHVATPLMIVDALDSGAAGFYRRYGFIAFPNRPLRLGARLKDIRKTFGALSKAAGHACQAWSSSETQDRTTDSRTPNIAGHRA